jgi:hypothetical protein
LSKNRVGELSDHPESNKIFILESNYAGEITTLQNRPNSPPGQGKFNFEEFKHIKIVYENKEKLYTAFLRGRGVGSAKQFKRLLISIDEYDKWYEGQAELHAPRSTSCITHSYTTSYGIYLNSRGSQSLLMELFIKLIREIVDDTSLIPLNVCPRKPSATRDVPAGKKLRLIMHEVRQDAEFIRKRFELGQRLKSTGENPAAADDEEAAWADLANRVYVTATDVMKAFGSWTTLRAQGRNDIIDNLQKYDGAPIRHADGSISHKRALNGHLRFLVPYNTDLAGC